MKLRDNQVEPVRIGTEFFLETRKSKIKPSIIVAPTAFGKSVVIAYICRNIKDKVIVIQPTKELLEQNYSKFVNLGGFASIYSASCNSKKIGNITYATIGSIKKLGTKFKELGFSKVIVDECDRYPRQSDGMFRTFIDTAEITHVLGFTATPLKLQTNSFNMESYSILKMLTARSKHGNFFKNIIHVTQISNMLENGYWTPLEYEQVGFDDSVLIYNTINSNYREDTVVDAYNNQGFEEKIIETIRRLDKRKSILVAVPSVEQARRLASRLDNAIAVWGNMPKKDRREAISNFKSLKTRIVVQVNVLSIGFDHPKLDCLICGRATASLAWWYQFIGRGTRIHPDKKNTLVVDLTNNLNKFGRVEHLRYDKEKNSWKLYGENDILLTNVPIHEIGTRTKKTEEERLGIIMPFGKYKGRKIENIPIDYMKWVVQNVDSKGYKPTEKAIKKMNKILKEVKNGM